MAAATYNFTIEQGATLSLPITWEDADGNPINLTGYSAKLQVRSAPADLSSTVLLELSTANSGIALGGVAGTITLQATATATSAYAWLNGLYDLELTSGSGFVTRILQGEVLLSQEVTR